MKVLRSVLAVGVGFALTPWLGRDVYAEGTSNGIVRTGSGQTNLIGANGSAANVADIYADKAANGVGLNAFQHFELGNNQIANLYFKESPTDTNVLNTLVNTVQNRISISGTVNAVRNGTIGGNLYFLSPAGMVVGSTGVINAGSLTVMTSGNTFSSAEAAAQALNDNSWGGLDSKASIDIHGRINTATGIDLRAAYINVKKAQGAVADAPGPALQTGAVFATTVNTAGLVTNVALQDGRLAASLDNKGNIVIADPSNPSGAQGDAALKGDGSIKLAAYSDSKNAKTNFLGISSITNTVEAKVEVGEGASLDARGNVEISAEAKRLQRTKITEFWDMVAFTKADATVNGSVTGADVNISSKASSEYAGGNYANIFDFLNDGLQETGVVELKSKFTGYFLGKLESSSHWGQGGMIANNIFNQLYMPFALTDAKATTTIGASANINAKVLKNGDVAPTYIKDNVAYTVGGNMGVSATSSAKNKMKVGIQPHIEEGTSDLSQYFTGGFIYQDGTSHATVNVYGKLQAEKDMNIAAEAKNTNSGNMSVLTPKFYDKGQHAEKYASMFMVGVGLSYQDTEATVNLGSATQANKGSEANPLLNAGGKLGVKANSTNEMECEVSVGSDLTAGKETDETAVSTAVNVVDTKGTATINDYVAVKGGSVNMEAQHSLDSFSISTCDEYVGEFTSLSWVINNDTVKEKADALKPFLQKIGLGNQMPDNPAGGGGAGGGGAAAGGANVSSWNEYFDIGASVAVANVTNNAKLNVYPMSFTEATDGDLNLHAGVEIGDTYFSTTNLLMNSNDTTYVTVAAAVGVEYMENTAEVNVNLNADGSSASTQQSAKLRANGDITIGSDVEQRYNRVDSMCDDLLDAWKSFLTHWNILDWSAGTTKDRINKLESCIIDILWLREKEKTDSYKDSTKFGKKASAAIDLIGSLTGTNELREALLAFLEPGNYVNMNVSAGAKNNDPEKQKDVTAVLTGSVGLQNLHNTANINVGANAVITAGTQNAANIAANVVETNVMAIGKINAFPYVIIDPTPVENAQNGIGGTVGVQNAYNNSKVKIMNGVTIDAGSIDIATKNDVLNIGIGIAGSQTSKLGLTGMVSYMGGESHAETLVDDDVSFTARKKVEKVAKKKDDGSTEYEDEVTSNGAVNISSTNATNIINLVGDWNSAEVSSVGASVGVISYDIHSLAELKNQELHEDGSSAETEATTNHKGSISANSVNVKALTDGVVNNITVAGVKHASENENQQAGGANAAAGGGAGAIAGGVQNANINDGNAGGQQASISLNAVGSVSWNYVVDETKATLDNVNINLTKADVAADVTDETLKNDRSASVKVEAEDASYIGAYSGAMALNKLGSNNNTKFQGTLAGAVAVNDLKKTTTVTLQNTDIKRSTADVGVDVLNYAHNSGAQVAAGLSLGLETGKRSGGIDINLAASGSANYVDSTVQADMLGNTIVGGSTVVNNAAYDKDVQVAGGVTAQVTKATASAGAAVTVNDVDNDIRATMNNNSIGTAAMKAAEVHNLAASNLTQVGTAISVGVATGEKAYAALNVAVAKNSVDNTVDATIDGGEIYANKLSAEAKDGKLSLDNEDNKYLTELNQTQSVAVTVDANGNFVKDGQVLSSSISLGNNGYFYKNGEKLTPSVELKEDGYYQGNDKLKANITKDATGNYLDINGEPITLSQEDGLYHDVNGKIVDVEDIRYYNSQNQEVDVANVVYRDTSGKIVDIYDNQYSLNGTVVKPNELNTQSQQFFDLNGNDALANANGANGVDIDATVGANADKATYNKSNITLTNQGNTIVGVALGLGVIAGEGGQGSGAAAAAANVNTITNDFTATIKNVTIGTGASSYEASGELKEAALRVEAASDTRMVSVAAGAAADAKSQGVSIALAGSGAVQGITNTTKAGVENSTISTDNLAVKSTTKSSLVSVAGQVSVETSQKGVAAGLTWAENNMHNTTGAYAKGITLNGIDGAATNLAVAAENKAKTWAVAVGASVALGNGAAEGAYAENSGKNDTEAIVDKYETKNEQGVVTSTRTNAINNAKSISVTAKDTSVEKGIAGSIAVTAGNNAMASIGGAVVYNNIGDGAAAKQKQTVKAQLNNAAITTASGANIKTKATNEADFLGLALGGAVRAGGKKFGVSAEGSVAVTTDYMNTIAGMENVNIDGGANTTGSKSSKVEVEATSTSDITSSADALSVSVGDGIQIAVGAAVSKVRSDADTTTSIKNSMIKAQDVIAKANSTNEILDVATGLSTAVGAGYLSLGLAGNVATNRIANDTTVTLEQDDIFAYGTVAALANSKEKLQNYGGAVSVSVTSGAAVALGATVVTNTIEGDTKSTVKDSNITAVGSGSGVQVDKHEIAVDDASKDSYKINDTTAPNTTAKTGLVVNADAVHTLRDIVVTGGVSVGGDVGVAGDATAAFETIKGETAAELLRTNVNSADSTSIIPKADVAVNAYDKADLRSNIGTLSVGVGGGVGVAAAGTGVSNIIDRTTKATIDGGDNANRKLLNGHNIAVGALGYTELQTSASGAAVGAGAEGGAAVNANASVTKFTSTTQAKVSNVSGNLHSLKLTSDRLANAHIYNNAVSVAAGATGAATIGVGVTYVRDTATTTATLENATFVNKDENKASSSVEVLANSRTRLVEEAVQADIAGALFSGSAGVLVDSNNINNKANVNVSNARIGTEEERFGSFVAKAENHFSNTYTNVGVVFGTMAGVGVGIMTNTVNTGVATNVLNSYTYANNITVAAEEKQTMDETTVGIAAGILNIPVNKTINNIGSVIADDYQYGETADDSFSTSELKGYVDGALSSLNDMTDRFQDANNQYTGDAGISSTGMTTMDNDNQSIAKHKGVQTTIEGSTLNASNRLDVHSKKQTNLSFEVGQGGIGAVGVNVSIGQATVDNELGVTLKNSSMLGKEVAISSEDVGELLGASYQAAVGAAQFNFAYTDITHKGNNKISIDGTSITSTMDQKGLQEKRLPMTKEQAAAYVPLDISATNNMIIDSKTVGVGIGGAKGGYLNAEAIDEANVRIDLGVTAAEAGRNTFKAEELSIGAYNDPRLRGKITNVGVSIVSGSASMAMAKVSGKAELIAKQYNTFDARQVELLAVTGNDLASTEPAGESEESKKKRPTTYVDVESVSTSGLDINVNKARTYNEMTSTTSIGAAQFQYGTTQDGENAIPVTGLTDVTIGAVNSTSSKANIYGVTVGIVAASGSNFAQTHSKSNASVSLDAGSGINVNSLDVYASNSDRITADAEGNSGGIINVAPYAAKVENSMENTTSTTVKGIINAADKVYAQALRKDDVNLRADAISAAVAGGSGTGVDSKITDTTDVNITQAQITAWGDLRAEAENQVFLNRGSDRYDRMVLGNGYGGLTVTVAGLENEVTSNAKVNIDQSTLTSKGDMEIIAHTNEDMRTNGYVYSMGSLQDANNSVTNTITNNDDIIIKGNSKLNVAGIGKDLTLSAADDMKLFTYSLAETVSASVVAVTTSYLDNILTRNNKLDLQNGTLYGLQDINLYAGMREDGNVAMLDLDAEAAAFNGAIISINIRPKVTNTIKQANEVLVGSSAKSTSVRHTNIYAGTGRELVRTTSGYYFNVYSDKEESIVCTDQGKVPDGQTDKNKVQIDGSVVAGIANNLNVTIGTENQKVVLDSALQNIASGTTTTPSVNFNPDPSTGLSAADIKFGTEDYANTLLNRYLQVEALISEYSKDTSAASQAAVVGYQAEAVRIKDTMVSMGLASYNAETNELSMLNSCQIDYVELPDLIASGGNVNVITSDLLGSGTIEAKGTPEITINNNTNLLLKVNNVIVDDPGGKLIYNNKTLTPTGADAAAISSSLKTQINAENKTQKNVSLTKVASANGQNGTITINGNYTGGNIHYQGNVTVDGTTHAIDQTVVPMANIQIQGNIINRDGGIAITSAHNDIIIQGKTAKDNVAINGATISLRADQGSITQGYTDGIVNIGGSVQDLYANEYNSIKTGADREVSVSEKTITPANDGGSYIAGGTIYINAADININGVIQSGFADYSVTIDASAQAAIDRISASYDGSRELSDANVTIGENYKIVQGGSYWNASKGCYEYRLNAYYNPSTKKIIVEDVDANGGRIYLTGRISSTGGGKIICLDGANDITVTNDRNYTLQLGDLVNNDVSGLVSITDTAKGTVTEITKVKENGVDKVQTLVKNIGDNGVVAAEGTTTTFTGNSTTYSPKSGLRYEWTSGENVTSYTRYKYDEQRALWGIWRPSATSADLASWETRSDVEMTTVADPTTTPRLNGEVISEGSTSSSTTGSITDGSYVKVSSQNITNKTSKESERYYSTGLWGYYKHHETIWTKSSGTVKTYFASIQADKPVDVTFIGKSVDEAKVKVDSLANIEMTGNIGNTKLYEAKDAQEVITGRDFKGSVEIISQNGSLLQTGGSLYGENIILAAGKDMRGISVTAGDNVNLSAVNIMKNAADFGQNTISINVKNAYGAQGNVNLGYMGSVIKNSTGYTLPVNSTGITGVVDVSAYGDISQKAGNNISIVSDRINLVSTNGAIYGQKAVDQQGKVTYSALKLYAGQQPIGLDTMDASVNANAKGDINLEQTAGNMRIGRIYATEGDVTLKVASGSIEDALPYELNGDRGDADDMVARWLSLGIIAGNDEMQEAKNAANAKYAAQNNTTAAEYKAWDQNALLFAIQDSIVNPSSEGIPQTSAKDPNVIGHNITINVADSVGMNSGNVQEIDITGLLAKNADGSYKVAGALDKLKTLAKADASTVTWRTDESTGHKIAIITETLPIGVQQTSKTISDGQGNTTIVNGKLTVQSQATAAQNGDIYLQGRDQKLDANTGINDITDNKNLHINNLYTQVGDVTLSSLGGIINAAGANNVAITGNSLYVTAGGTIGAADNALTMLLVSDASDKGLSAVASGGIYIDNLGNKNTAAPSDLRIINVSSGGDIYLGSDQNIFMGVVNGTEAVNYIRAENNGDIVLEARGGDIGEFAYEKDAQGNDVLDAQDNRIVARDTNNGVRILNSANASNSVDDTNVSHVILKAHDNVYVTGVASADGKTALAEGPAGVLNLTVESTNASVPLQNVGIYVDGVLNLEQDLQTSATASAFVTGDLNLDSCINLTSADTYLGSGGDLTVNKAVSIVGTEKLTLAAVGNLKLENASLQGKNLLLQAGKDVVHEQGTITASEKAFFEADGNVLLKGGSLNAKNVDMLALGYVDESYDNSLENANGYALSVSETLQVLTSGNNAADGHNYGVDLGSKFNQLHNVILDSDNGNIIVGSGNTNAVDLNVSVQSGKIVNGNIEITNYNYNVGVDNDINIQTALKAKGDIKVVNHEKDINVQTGTEVDGQRVTLNAIKDINNYASINSVEETYLVAGKDINNDANITSGKRVVLLSLAGNIDNSGTIQAVDTVDMDAVGGNVYNFASINSTNGYVDIYAHGTIFNIGDTAEDTIKAKDYVQLLAGDMLWNTAKINSAESDVYITAGNQVFNYADSDLTDPNNLTNQDGYISAAGSVVIKTTKENANGVYNSANIEAGNIVLIEDKGSLDNKGNITATKDITLQAVDNIYNPGNYLVTGSGDISLSAGEDIINTGNFTLENDGNITVTAGKTISNSGNYRINGTGNIAVTANGVNTVVDGVSSLSGGDIINHGNYFVKSGDITMTSNEDVLNTGVMETERGNISIISLDGVIFNESGADLLSGNGDVNLRAESQKGYYYYFDNAGALQLVPQGTALQLDFDGEYVAVIDGVERTILKNGSVFNAGDILALNGTITLEAVKGNLTNYDDFNTLSTSDVSVWAKQYKGTNIATGNIVFSAGEGHLFNEKDLESGENIILVAAEGLENFAYDIYAGKNISLVAKSGDLVNTAVLESLYGDVTLLAEQGNVINGTSTDAASGDIITLGGTVTLEARGADANAKGYSVTNYGDIIAIGKTTNDAEGSGSIILQSELGNVYNNDDFNRLHDGSESYAYDASKHISVVGKPEAGAGYNIATSNIEILAEQGEIVNTKQYLVALGDVTLRAKEGVGSYGQMIMAGGNITLSDTDGNLVNRAQLLSVDGDITLNAEEGTIINMLDGDVLALNGNVTLHAGAAAAEQVRYVGIDGSNTVINGEIANVPEGSIIVTKKYYVLNGQTTEMVNDATVPNGATVQTVVGYLDTNNDDAFVALQTINGDVEAYRKGDVVNRGDLVALNPNNVEGKGSISLISDHGNATNFDNFKMVDGLEQYEYKGKSGYGVGSNETANFNAGTKYYYDKGMVLSDADLTMVARKGYLYNTMNMHSEKDLTLISGKDMTVGTNFAAIDAVGDITLESTEGMLKVKDGSSINSSDGSILLEGQTGILNSQSATITAAQDVTMNSAAGAITNDSAVSATNGSVEMNGNHGINNNAGAAITAGQNVVLQSEAGAINNASSITAQRGSIVLDSQGSAAASGGISSTAPEAKLSALNGSISAVVKYGEVNISELIAKDTAAAGTFQGTVNVGTIKGDDVVLYTEDVNSDIIVNDITVGDHLLLQGNSFKHEVAKEDGSKVIVDGLGKINRSSSEGTLLVDVNGVGAGGGSGATKTDVNMEIEGDVRFTTLNVTNANIFIGGEMKIDKLHVGGEAHFNSLGYVTGVYGGGMLPNHDASNALYYDLGDGSGNGGLNLRVSAEKFRVVREGEQEQLRALTTMKALKERLKQASTAPETFGQSANNNGWMNLYVDTAKYQRSNGLLLHIDTGYRSANQRWSAEDLSTNLADFQSNETYVAHYGDVVGSFGRYDLIEVPNRPVGELLHTASSGRVVLQKDNKGLRIEEEQGDEE